MLLRRRRAGRALAICVSLCPLAGVCLVGAASCSTGDAGGSGDDGPAESSASNSCRVGGEDGGALCPNGMVCCMPAAEAGLSFLAGPPSCMPSASCSGVALECNTSANCPSGSVCCSEGGGTTCRSSCTGNQDESAPRTTSVLPLRCATCPTMAEASSAASVPGRPALRASACSIRPGFVWVRCRMRMVRLPRRRSGQMTHLPSPAPKATSHRARQGSTPSRKEGLAKKARSPRRQTRRRHPSRTRSGRLTKMKAVTAMGPRCFFGGTERICWRGRARSPWDRLERSGGSR